MVVFTVGYQQRDLDAFVALLSANQVQTLVDVRENPISRKRGFSKRALASALADADIHYLHAGELGNPKSVRRAATTIADCLRRYRVHMTPLWDGALRRVDTLADQRICLMCYEREFSECHRSVVAEQIEARIGVAPRHL